jgi:hypothetical protein
MVWQRSSHAEPLPSSWREAVEGLQVGSSVAALALLHHTAFIQQSNRFKYAPFLACIRIISFMYSLLLLVLLQRDALRGRASLHTVCACLDRTPAGSAVSDLNLVSIVKYTHSTCCCLALHAMLL